MYKIIIERKVMSTIGEVQMKFYGNFKKRYLFSGRIGPNIPEEMGWVLKGV